MQLSYFPTIFDNLQVLKVSALIPDLFLLVYGGTWDEYRKFQTLNPFTEAQCDEVSVVLPQKSNPFYVQLFNIVCNILWLGRLCHPLYVGNCPK